MSSVRPNTTSAVGRAPGAGAVAALAAAACLALTACDYVRLLRPKVLHQLNPRVVRLVNFLPEVDEPNEAILARLPGHGGLSYAREGRDGVMRVTVRAPVDEPELYGETRGSALLVFALP